MPRPLSPCVHAICAMQWKMRRRMVCVGHAVVVRVLVDERGNEKGAEELAGHVLRKADADVAAPAGKAGAVCRVRVGGDRDAGFTGDGEKVEGVQQVVSREQCLFLGGERLDLRAVEESGVPVTHGQERNADFRLYSGCARRGIDPCHSVNCHGAHGRGGCHGCAGVLDQAGPCELLGKLVQSRGWIRRCGILRRSLRRGLCGSVDLRKNGEWARGIGRLCRGGVACGQSKRQDKAQIERQEKKEARPARARKAIAV